MTCRRRLVIRRGKGGGISSPTSTTGYVFIGVVATAMGAASVVAVLPGHLAFLIGVAIACIPVRDVWAWLAATPQERQAFRAEVSANGGGPDQHLIGAGWGPEMLRGGEIALAAA